MSTAYSNNLYPFDEEVSDLEAAAREAEWNDDTSGFIKKRRRKHQADIDNEDVEFL